MNTETAAPLESTIEDHIAATSKLVRQVDTALALSAVFSFLLGGTFLAVLADHWFCTDGLSLFMRFGIFTALAAAAGLYTFYRIIPLYRRPINPVYTADLIEQSAPSFKNSLINWLLIRREREVRRTAAENKIAERMFDGVVRSAAVSVHSVPANHAVDFRQLIQAGTVLVLLLTAFIAYAAFSPKSPLASLARIILPFSSIEPPQAVQFRNVKPGNAVFLQGETAVISAEVIGRSSEPVYLVFSSDDGQAAGQRIPMQQFDGKAAFETVFPPGKQGNDRGFSCGIVYWIAQAGSKSPKYRIDVKPAASIEMTSLHYRYPAYTGLKNETVEHGGDIRALEGTEMTVAVRSTLPLKNIDIAFDGDPKQKIPMKLSNSNTEASVAFKLDLSKPHKTFVFQALDETGTPSRRSGIYRIEIIEDKPPFIQWADTAAELNNAAQIDLPENQTLTLPIQAEDPDFALRTIRLRIESDKGKEQIFLLESSPSGPTEHRGQIKRTAVFSPSEHPFRAGDDLEIYAEAEDTKLPHANRCETRKIKIKIVEPKQEDSKNEKQKVPDKQNKQNTDEKQNGNEGKKGEEQKNGGEQNENPQAGDPDKNDPNQNPQNQQPPNEQNKQNGNEGNQNDPQQKPEPQAGQNQEGNQKGEQKGHQGGDSPQNGNQPENSKDGNSGDPPPDRGENNAAAAASDTEGNAGDGVKAGENVDDANRKGQTGDGRESGSNPSDSAAQGGQGNGEKSKGGSDSNHRTQQEAESG
ncbi:MAG: hypothetical protein LBH00_03165, partial [Planctomycetaceae bacterium]|nr:hypothetical protein [Planctomycetaceae bacterium]